MEEFFKAESVEMGDFAFLFVSDNDLLLLALVATACLVDVVVSQCSLVLLVLLKLAFRWLLEATEGTVGEDLVRTAFSNSERESFLMNGTFICVCVFYPS